MNGGSVYLNFFQKWHVNMCRLVKKKKKKTDKNEEKKNQNI